MKEKVVLDSLRDLLKDKHFLANQLEEKRSLLKEKRLDLLNDSELSIEKKEEMLSDLNKRIAELSDDIEKVLSNTINRLKK